MTRAASGRSVDDLTLDRVMTDDLSANDIRISADALRHQAQVSADNGNPQLAENLRRAAELTALPDAEVLAIYEALRPSRSTETELEQLAADLRRRGAERCAALVLEALAAYRQRGLTRGT